MEYLNRFEKWVKENEGIGQKDTDRVVAFIRVFKDQPRYEVRRIDGIKLDYMVYDSHRNANLAIFYQKNYQNGEVYCAKKEAQVYCDLLNTEWEKSF